MAFLNRISGVLKQTVSKHMNMELSASNTSVYQAIRSMSSSKLFIGGLSYGTDEMSLREAFSQHGEVVEARIIMDRETGRSRGFGFVTYTSSEEASSAMQAMDGQDLHGRRIRVNYATERSRSGGFRGEGGFGYGGGGGSYGGSGGYGDNSYGGSGGYGSNSYGSAGGYGTNNYGGAGGYGNASNYGGAGGDGNAGNYGGAGGNFGGGGGGDGYGSSFGGGGGYSGDNYNSGVVSNYASGASNSDGVYSDAAPGAGGGYYNSGIPNDGGLATSGYDQGQMHGNQRDTVAVDEDFGDDMVEGHNRDDNDTPDNYANTRG